jgi:predicted phage-related endonuclease
MAATDLSPERLGLLTGSMAAVIMGGLKTEGLDNYVRRLAGERLHGVLDEEEFTSRWMKRGKKFEPRALDWYEFHTDTFCERQVFVRHRDMPYVAATPDGLIHLLRTIETKAPSFAEWSQTKQTREVPPEYRWQCRWQAWAAGVKEFHFVAWHPQGGGVIVKEELLDADVIEMTNRAITVEMMVQEMMEEIA